MEPQLATRIQYIGERLRRAQNVSEGTITIPPRTRLRAAMALAILADVVQMAVFPLFVEGAASPADDILDLCVGGALSFLLGWHWEFLPSFAAKLIPGVDLVPLWTLAVGNVYRKSKLAPANVEGQGVTIEGKIDDATQHGARKH